MKLVKEAAIIFGVTMVGELLYTLLPLPVPAGVYGLFLLLFLLALRRSKAGTGRESGNVFLGYYGHDVYTRYGGNY